MPKSDGHVLTYDKSFNLRVLAPPPSSLGFPAVLPTNPSTISLSLLPICFVYFLTVTVFLERPSLDMVKIAQLQAAATFLEQLPILSVPLRARLDPLGTLSPPLQYCLNSSPSWLLSPEERSLPHTSTLPIGVGIDPRISPEDFARAAVVHARADLSPFIVSLWIYVVRLHQELAIAFTADLGPVVGVLASWVEEYVGYFLRIVDEAFQTRAALFANLLLMPNFLHQAALVSGVRLPHSAWEMAQSNLTSFQGELVFPSSRPTYASSLLLPKIHVNYAYAPMYC
ncbi:hypothetical protein BDP27DRAFT_1429192 [Rhodocollybia butyracea]|uniref:Uncharacterized protein n=1 Tax=Rhodocollybia butyracea TaxID=206335 RepID=A0A9P5PDM5_9AGAR|nr:hypothetical protein BDP27DRAFT_1429192 [Rhodocollybia butyracea]